MKKILLLIVFVMGAMFVQAQSAKTDKIAKMQTKEMDAIEKRVTYNIKNLTFNKNQTVKLERLLNKKVTEIIDLRATDIAKGAYVKAHIKIVKKYEPMIEAILTKLQKVEYRRNSKKHLRRKKD